jgi:hypothetical protein
VIGVMTLLSALDTGVGTAAPHVSSMPSVVPTAAVTTRRTPTR